MALVIIATLTPAATLCDLVAGQISASFSCNRMMVLSRIKTSSKGDSRSLRVRLGPWVRGSRPWDTHSRRKAHELRAEARKLEKDATTMAGVRETEELVAIKANMAKELKTVAKALNQSARLEDITVWQNPVTKQTKKGDRIYYRWVC